MSEPALRSAYAARDPLLKELAARLDDATRAALDGVPHIDRICFRVKDLASGFLAGG
jgi:hypothetical protein